MYLEDLITASNNIKNLEYLHNKKIFISGAAGQVGKSLVSLFIHLNDAESYGIHMVLNTRSESRIETTFSDIKDRNDVEFYIGDVINPIAYEGEIDYIISAASNTHPRAYAEFPVETVLTNVDGAKNMFELAVAKNARVINVSTVEIYGDNQVEKPFSESDMGYLDPNTTRACYNESKRLAETLSQAYISEKGLDSVTVRLPRLFGPETKNDDSKALSQFIANARNGENIVLKSEGTQFFSYLYAPDAVSGILSVMINGKKGEAYNLSSSECDIRLKDLAKQIAEIKNVEVVFDIPDAVESAGFSKAQYAILDSSKIRQELGWSSAFDIKTGLLHTI